MKDEVLRLGNLELVKELAKHGMVDSMLTLKAAKYNNFELQLYDFLFHNNFFLYLYPYHLKQEVIHMFCI